MRSLLLALLYEGRHSQRLEARLQCCEDVHHALEQPELVYRQALSDAQQDSRQALIQLTTQLQQLHASAAGKYAAAPEAVSVLSQQQANDHGNDASATLSAADFCSDMGFQSWAQLCWQHHQDLLVQLQQLPEFCGELQLHVHHAVLNAPEPQPTCLRCLCARPAEPSSYNPYCVIWLKNNVPAHIAAGLGGIAVSYSNQQLGGPLLLMNPSWQQTKPVSATGSTAVSLASMQQPQQSRNGTQTQRTAVIERCNQPLWSQELDTCSVASQDAVIRLQVRSSTSTGATLDWFGQSLAAAGLASVQDSSSGSKLSSISDPMIGQISMKLSSLHQAMQQASGTDHSGWAQQQQQQQQQLVLPLYGPLRGSNESSTAETGQLGNLQVKSTRAVSKRGFGLASGKYKAGFSGSTHQQLPDFVTDAVFHEQQVAAAAGGTTAVVTQKKVPMTVRHTASAVSQGLQHLVLYDPVSGASCGVQGREMVGRLHLLVTYMVEEQLLPSSSPAELCETPVQAVLDSLGSHGQQVGLPQPLCPFCCSENCTSTGGGPATESPSGAGQTALAAAQQLAAAVWKLWKVGGLADKAAEYKARYEAACMPPAAMTQAADKGGADHSKPTSHITAAAAASAASAGGISSPRLVARGRAGDCLQGLVSEGSGADWTLGTCNSYAGSTAQIETYSDGFSYLRCEYELSHAGSGPGPRDSWHSSSSTNTPRWIGQCRGTSRSNYSSRDGSSVRSSDWGQPLSPVSTANGQSSMVSSTGGPAKQGSRLQKVSHDTVVISADSSQLPGQQQDSRSGEQQVPGQLEADADLAVQHNAISREAAAIIMQLLSLQRLASSAARMEGEGVLPGIFYLHLLHDAAVLSGVRPAAVRLALLEKLLQSWLPDQPHLQALVDLISPLMIADRQLLLTWQEAKTLHGIAGGLLDTVQQLLSCHYDLYPESSKAAACLSLLLALLASLSGSPSQHQLVEAASPLLVSAVKRSFMQAIEPEAAGPAAAALDVLLGQMLGEPVSSADIGDRNGPAEPTAAVGRGEAGSELGPLAAATVGGQPAQQVQQAAGLLDMFRFRDSNAVIGGPAGPARAADGQKGLSGRPEPPNSGLFNSLLETLQQRRTTGAYSHPAEAHSAGDSNGIPFWRNAAVLQQPLQRSAAGPVAEGLLRSDSDEALEAACRALDMSESQGQGKVTSNSAGAVGSKAADSGLINWGKGTGGSKSGQLNAIVESAPISCGIDSSAPAMQEDVAAGQGPAVAAMASTASARNKSSAPVIANDEIPAVNDFVIHTRLEYDTQDSTQNSSKNRLAAAFQRRRATASAVLSDSGISQTAASSTSNPGSAEPVQLPANSRGRHSRFGSVGTLDGLLSRLGRVTRDDASTYSTDGIAAGAASSNPSLLKQHTESVPARVSLRPPSAAAANPVFSPASLGSTAQGSKMLGRNISHGRSGSAGSLDLWNSHKQAYEDQQRQQQTVCSSSEGSEASVMTSEDEGSKVAVAQNAEWDRDVINLTVAVGVVLEELQRDIRLQEELPPQLQLPLIGLHVRYSLVHSHLSSLIACGHETTYDSSLRQLEKAVRQLHQQLIDQGWAVPAGSNGQDAFMPGQLPQRDAEGSLPPVVLCDLDNLMVPVWTAWLKKSGQHLLSVVDGLLAAQSSSTSSKGRHSGWVPVAADQGALYSSSVVDLFQLLEGLADQVLEQAVKPVASLDCRAANISLLAAILEAAMARYVAHLHAAAMAMLKFGQVVMPPGSVVQSGKVTRHRRGESMGSPASRPSSATALHRLPRHTRGASNVPAVVSSPLGPASAGPTGASISSNGSTTGNTSFFNTGLFARDGSDLFGGAGRAMGCFAGAVSVLDGSDGSSNSLTARGLSAATVAAASSVLQQEPVLRSEMCVVLNSLQEVLLQQQQLEQRIWGELGGDPAEPAQQAIHTSQHPDSDVENSKTALDAVLLPTPAAQRPTQADSGGLNVQQGSSRTTVPAGGDADNHMANSSLADADDIGDESDVSVMSFTDDESDRDDEQPSNTQQDHRTPANGTLHHAAEEQVALPDAAEALGPMPQQQQQFSDAQQSSIPSSPWQLKAQRAPQQVLSHTAAEQVAETKRGSIELSAKIKSVMLELLQFITAQLQSRETDLLAALFAVWADAGALTSADAIDFSDPGVQLVLAPLFTDLASLQQTCCPEVCQMLIMAQWKALLAVISQLALCQAATSGATAISTVPQPLQQQHIVLLQRLLLLLQSEFSDAVVASVSKQHKSKNSKDSSSSDKVAAAVAEIAAAAVHARTLLQLLQQPTSQVIQKYLDSSSSTQQQQLMHCTSNEDQQIQGGSRWQPVGRFSSKAFGQQLTQLDIIRCLWQRVQDAEAQVFVQLQLRRAGTDAMRLLFGRPQQEVVKVYAACATAASIMGVAGCGGNNNRMLSAILSTVSSGSSAAAAYSTATGCLYLSHGYLAFTDIITDVHGDEDDEAFTKRFKKHLAKHKTPAVDVSSNKTFRPAEAGMTGADANPAAAGATGSSTSSLGGRSWWKGVKQSAGGGGGSGTTPAAGSSAAIGMTADTTLLIPLATVSRLDKVYHRGQDALSITLLDSSSRVFYGFESTGVRDRLYDEVRLTVMGSNTVLDRNLRCLEPTEVSLELGLPANERLIRVYQCLKYGTVRNKPGNLYICTSLLAYDYDDSEPSKPTAAAAAPANTATVAGPASGGATGGPVSSHPAGNAAFGGHHHRPTGGSGPEQLEGAQLLLAIGSRVIVRYQDISRMKQEKAQWGENYWVVISYVGLKGESGKLEIGGATQLQAAEMLADIERAMSSSAS